MLLLWLPLKRNFVEWLVFLDQGTLNTMSFQRMNELLKISSRMNLCMNKLSKLQLFTYLSLRHPTLSYFAISVRKACRSEERNWGSISKCCNRAIVIAITMMLCIALHRRAMIKGLLFLCATWNSFRKHPFDAHPRHWLAIVQWNIRTHFDFLFFFSHFRWIFC